MNDEPQHADGSARRSRATKAIAALAAVVLIAAFAVTLVRRGSSASGADRDHLSVAVTDFEGGRFTLASYRGRPMVVNFWASWCPSCAAEMPAFEQVHQRFTGSVEFLGVNHSDTRSSAEELAQSTGVTYRLAEDPRGELFSALGGVGMPTTALITADGTVAEVVVGQIDEEQLTSLIEEHLDPETGSASGGSALDPDDIVEVIAPDGIPAIDDPSFVPVREVDWLNEREPVIALQLEDAARAYPLQIMTWHEIVNDVVGGTPVAVTFCPLCNTAIAFERPRIDGEITTFGTSGKLINSNLIMYDRATESLWPQVTGVALTGPQKGRELIRVPAQIVSWGDFASEHPDGDVLSRDTGHDRRYGENPYPGYDDVGKPPFLYSGEVDGRLAAVERVLAIEAGGDAVAFPYFRLRQAAQDGIAVVEAEVDQKPVVVFWKQGTASALDETDIAASKDVGAASAFSAVLDGELATFAVTRGKVIDTRTRSVWNIFGRAVEGRLKGQELDLIPATDSFWFDWAAFHPDTELWSP